MPSQSVPAAFESAVRELVSARVPQWDLSISAGGQGHVAAWVSLSHPLSDGHRFGFSKENVDALDLRSFEAMLAGEPEFAQTATAPTASNPILLRELRRLARLFGWDGSQFRALISVLHDAGCLTEPEAEWLSETADGPGEERPAN